MSYLNLHLDEYIDSPSQHHVPLEYMNLHPKDEYLWKITSLYIMNTIIPMTFDKNLNTQMQHIHNSYNSHREFCTYSESMFKVISNIVPKPISTNLKQQALEYCAGFIITINYLTIKFRKNKKLRKVLIEWCDLFDSEINPIIRLNNKQMFDRVEILMKYCLIKIDSVEPRIFRIKHKRFTQYDFITLLPWWYLTPSLEQEEINKNNTLMNKVRNLFYKIINFFVC